MDLARSTVTLSKTRIETFHSVTFPHQGPMLSEMVNTWCKKKLIKNNSENSAISFIEDCCSSLSRRICCDLSKLSRMPQSFYEGHV